MTLSVFWNSPYRPSLTTTQISLRITTLLLSISCLAITINLSLHFSLTYLIVYIALMFSIFVSQAAIMKLISKPSHHNFCAEHLILVGFEALVLAYWTIVFVLMKTGKGTLDSEDIRWVDGRGGEEWARSERIYRQIHQGLIIGIMQALPSSSQWSVTDNQYPVPCTPSSSPSALSPATAPAAPSSNNECAESGNRATSTRCPHQDTHPPGHHLTPCSQDRCQQ